MKQLLKQIVKYIVLFLIGGGIYYLIEVCARGYSHISMFVLGGICFVLLGVMNETLSWETPLYKQMLIGCILITVLEFVTGCIVNIWLGWDVWDYSNCKYQILGQIELKHCCYWYFLSLVGIVLDDYIRYIFFDEEKPRYKLV